MRRNRRGIEIAEIIPDRCIGCQICAAECPVGAIEMVDGIAVIDQEACVGCGKCFEVCPVEAVLFESKRRTRRAEGRKRPAKGDFTDYLGVAVFVEVSAGKGAQVSWELVGKAQELAGKLDTKAIGLLLGHNVDDIAREAIAYGCNEVHVIDHPGLEIYLSEPYGDALTDLCKEIKPAILLIGATSLGRDLAGVVATKIRTGLTADCTGLDIDEETGLLLMTRPTFGGNIMATIFCEHHRPQMSTVRPRVFRLHPKDPNLKGEIHTHEWTPPGDEVPEVVDFIEEISEVGSVDIARAQALVVAGKGACNPEFFPVLQDLADQVGGVVACSRPVVEAGLMPYDRQVGQTGRTVAPKLYIGIGVSGSVQHLVGMQGSEKIVAINSDPNAPIFRVADLGIVGDYTEVVPALIEELGRRMPFK